jgi:SSS family solute:Na+ symporter
MFILGFFWKKTTSNAALFATIGGFAFSLFLKFLPKFADLSFLSSVNFSVLTAEGLYEIPFLDRMGIVFIFCLAGMFIISKIENARGVVPNGLAVDKKMFKIDPGFAVGALIICGILAALFTMFW